LAWAEDGTDEKVSKLVLGCMQYGSGQDWMIPDHDEGVRQLKYAYDKGINVGFLL
jgi:aryl-alcohol dehydrogenase-like predicted oxidoreductase